MSSTIEEELEEAGDCEECSNRSTYKGLFLNLQVACCIIEGWSVYLYDYK